MRRAYNEYYYDTPYMGVGSVHDLSDSEGPGKNVAIILVPDPEQHKGWREHYVFRKEETKKDVMGFRPKGGS